MNKRINKIIVVLIAVISLSCSKFQKAQKSSNPEEKYAKAVAYYEKGDYYRAGILFEELLPMLKGTKNAETAQLKYCYCQFYSNQFYLSNYYFNKFYETYPSSPDAEEALFMSAKSNFLNSPEVELDQTNTQETLDAFQNFLYKYPESKFKADATEMIDNCRKKLEIKAYNNAMLFYKLDNYKAAIITFDNFKNGYPESSKNEEISFLKIKTQYNYAHKSIDEKKLERFNKALEFYEQFIDKYPKSSYLKDAISLYENISKEIKFINKINKKNG